MHACALRGDDAKIVNICDLSAPEDMTAIGPAECKLFTLVLNGGKTGTAGKAQYAGFTRHSDVHSCPVGALARYLCYRFTLEKEPFPDPLNWENDW